MTAGAPSEDIPLGIGVVLVDLHQDFLLQDFPVVQHVVHGLLLLLLAPGLQLRMD